ncbi:uncharacterized protein LOC126748912 [Anthonomus grandis grandis]|uniref:uncharacterized protein LOC126748912 n=1 Tax=Anthonomus grandis grandis TaxID=2921223 RepID=UPI0021665C5A|nr:uncharacterized protein LOC126748912 [Anthonomus grandis grandis]
MPRVKKFDINAYSLKDQITVYEAVTTMLNSPDILAECYPDGGLKLMEVRRKLKKAIIAKNNAIHPKTRINLMELTVNYSLPNHGKRCECSNELARELFKTILKPNSGFFGFSLLKSAFEDFDLEDLIHRFVAGRIFAGIFYGVAFLFYMFCIYLIIRWWRLIYGLDSI